MKKAIVKILIFIAPLLAAYSYIEYKLSLVPNSYNIKRDYLEKQLKNIDVLVLGSSNSLYAIDPSVFSHRGFNLANVSQTEYYDNRLTRKYIEKMPNLKIVLIPISYFSFYSQIHDGSEAWRDFFYYHFWDIKYKDFPLFDANRYSYIALYSLDVTKQYIKNGFKPLEKSLEVENEDGYATNDSTGHLDRISDSLGKVRADYHNKGYYSCLKANPNEIEYIVNDLNELVSYIQSKNVKVIFITMPAFHTYSDHCSKEILLMNDSLMHQLCNKYSVPYFNYFYDSRFIIDDFADNDHLSTIGAAKFSKIINNEIILPSFK